ncbi:MAG: zinc ribbon domain-containing protein [Candidatus Nitrosocaldaceae archaeon]
MAKTEHFTNLNVDLERLATRIETYLQENEYEVAFSKDQTEPASWFFIQARKLSALRTVAGARRSIDIIIRGSPNDFSVNIGSGEWGKNMLASAPLFIVPLVGVTVTVAKLYAGKKAESNIWKFIKEQASYLANSAKNKEHDLREYACDYVEGYPELKKSIEGGKLILERSSSGKNRIIFRGNSSEIIIPAENVESAQIIAKRKGLHEDDLMIKVAYTDINDRKLKVVFNINDDIIRGVLGGIKELVGEDKILKSIEHINIISDVKFCPSCGAQVPKSAKFCMSCGAQV